MTMPETSINLNDGLIARKYKVGLARKIFDVQAVAEAERVQVLSNQELWLGIPAPDPRHNVASFFRAKAISQLSRLCKKLRQYLYLYSENNSRLSYQLYYIVVHIVSANKCFICS